MNIDAQRIQSLIITHFGRTSTFPNTPEWFEKLANPIFVETIRFDSEASTIELVIENTKGRFSDNYAIDLENVSATTAMPVFADQESFAVFVLENIIELEKILYSKILAKPIEDKVCVFKQYNPIKIINDEFLKEAGLSSPYSGIPFYLQITDNQLTLITEFQLLDISELLNPKVD